MRNVRQFFSKNDDDRRSFPRINNPVYVSNIRPLRIVWPAVLLNRKLFCGALTDSIELFRTRIDNDEDAIH